MAKRSIVFIINPISGTQSKDNIIELISQHLDQDKFNYQIARTEYAGHATLLVQEHVEKGCDAVVAIGGDGTVNEIARSLVHTSVAFLVARETDWHVIYAFPWIRLVPLRYLIVLISSVWIMGR